MARPRLIPAFGTYLSKGIVFAAFMAATGSFALSRSIDWMVLAAILGFARPPTHQAAFLVPVALATAFLGFLPPGVVLFQAAAILFAANLLIRSEGVRRGGSEHIAFGAVCLIVSLIICLLYQLNSGVFARSAATAGVALVAMMTWWAARIAGAVMADLRNESSSSIGWAEEASR